MKKNLLILMIFCISFLFSNHATAAYLDSDLIKVLNGQNITGSDGFSNSNSFYGVSEIDEVEPGSSPDNFYDLEAMLWDNTSKTLGIVGNFDYVYGVGTNGSDGGSNGIIESGDIFITTSASTFVLDLDFSTLKYDVYQFAAGTDLTPITFQPTTVPASGPWQLNTAGLTASMTNIDLGHFTSFNNPSSPLNGFGTSPLLDPYDAILVDLAFLNGEAFSARYTIECGNDLIVGTSPVPEPNTMLLFGLGLLGMSAIGRKKT